jgi:hypothetical protein
VGPEAQDAPDVIGKPYLGLAPIADRLLHGRQEMPYQNDLPTLRDDLDRLEARATVPEGGREAYPAAELKLDVTERA